MGVCYAFKYFYLCLATIACSAPGSAWAQCTLPYQLTNGQTADASEVMANYNALLDCINNASPAGSENAVQYNAGSETFGAVGPLTDGQLVIGATGGPPQAQSLTAGTGISITNGSGSIVITATGSGGGGSGSGLYNQVLSVTPTSAGTGLTSWLNQGSAVLTESPVGISVNAPTSGASANLAGRYKAAPTPPYKLTALIGATRSSNSYSAVGLGWYDGTNKLHLLSYTISNGNVPYLAVNKWNSPTSLNGADLSSSPNGFSQPIWLQIGDDGTNVSFAFSQDGANFLPLFSVAKSSGFLGASGYSNVIFTTNPQGGRTIGTLMSWRQD